MLNNVNGNGMTTKTQFSICIWGRGVSDNFQKLFMIISHTETKKNEEKNEIADSYKLSANEK